MHGGDPFGLVGATIAGKFRVERVLGEGGFGVVYAGTHVMLGERVAIKCLKPTGFTPEDRERGAQAFLREARILFGLGHPAIVRLYDVGVLDDRQIPYVVLELLAGTTLEAEIQARAATRRHFGRDEIVAIFGPILEAVAFAHERGVVHRDLKPANLMLVSEAGRLQPKVLDFGTARADQVGTGRAGAVPDGTRGNTGFTPLYAAPEQWDAVYGATGARTDVYALGLTLAEMCLLGYPMNAEGGLLAVFKAALDESARPVLAQGRPDLPPELEQVVLRAMRSRPLHRYADARELLAAFRGALRVAPATAPMAAPMAAPSPSHLPPSPSHLPPSGAPSHGHGAWGGPPPPQAVVYVGSSTTQPHAMGLSATGAPPSQASPLPWILAVVGLLMAVMVAGLAVVVVAARAAPAAGPPSPAIPSSPVAPSLTPSPPAVTPAATPVPAATAVAPAAPAPGPVAKGPAPRIILGGAIGMAPFWTQSDVMNVARSHHAEMIECAREAVAAQPRLEGSISVTVSPDKNGVVGSVQCSMREHGTPGELALCGCASGAMGRWKYPPARGKLGFLDAGPFIYDYKLFPP
jgi:eukaryotic-like serine/threonine-protein kinase